MQHGKRLSIGATVITAALVMLAIPSAAQAIRLNYATGTAALEYQTIYGSYRTVWGGGGYAQGGVGAHARLDLSHPFSDQIVDLALT